MVGTIFLITKLAESASCSQKVHLGGRNIVKRKGFVYSRINIETGDKRSFFNCFRTTLGHIRIEKDYLLRKGEFDHG